MLHICRSQSGRQGRDDKGAHQSARPETKTIRQGEDRTVWTSQMSRLRLEAVEQGMAVRTLGLFSESRVSSGQLLLCSRSSLIGLITLDVKCAGARSAGNPHATCDVAGAGNGVTAIPKRARRGKPRTQPRRSLRAAAPALDPTCVQQRLACSVGGSPTGVIVRNPVAWVAFVEETKRMKPTDKAILGMVSESLGRNESEPRGGLDKI